MITDNGINRIKNLFGADLSSGQLGIGTTAVSGTDTALENPVSPASLAVTISTSSDKQVNTTYTLDSVTANGYTFTEYGTTGTTSVFYDRIVFTGLLKTNTREIVVSKRYFVGRG